MAVREGCFEGAGEDLKSVPDITLSRGQSKNPGGFLTLTPEKEGTNKTGADPSGCPPGTPL